MSTTIRHGRSSLRCALGFHDDDEAIVVKTIGDAAPFKPTQRIESIVLRRSCARCGAIVEHTIADLMEGPEIIEEAMEF